MSTVGEGTRTPAREVVHADLSRRTAAEARRRPRSCRFAPQARKQGVEQRPLPIRGLIPGMAVHFAGCCHPLPGDRIVGIVTTGKGVTIHTIDCETLESFADTPERWLDVAWDDDGRRRRAMSAASSSRIANEPGSLGSLTTVIGKNGGNITNLKITNRSRRFLRDPGRYRGAGREAPHQHHRRAARDAGDQLGRARAQLIAGTR